MADKPKTVSAFIISNFCDAGAERRFSAGDIVSIEEGPFGNFKAAGLVRAATAEDRKAAEPTKPSA